MESAKVNNKNGFFLHSRAGKNNLYANCIYFYFDFFVFCIRYVLRFCLAFGEIYIHGILSTYPSIPVLAASELTSRCDRLVIGRTTESMHEW